MLTKAQLESGRQELVAERDNLNKRIDALDALIALYGPPSTPVRQNATGLGITIAATNNRVTAEDLFSMQPRPSMHFDVQLLEMLRTVGCETNWTSRTAYVALRERDIPISGKDVDAQINTVLSALYRLTSSGWMEVISQGVGRRPTVFKLVERVYSDEKEASPVEKAS